MSKRTRVPGKGKRAASLLSCVAVPRTIYQRTSTVSRDYPPRPLMFSALDAYCAWLALGLFIEACPRRDLRPFPTAADLEVLEALRSRFADMVGIPSEDAA